jgi:hypothetical protein
VPEFAVQLRGKGRVNVAAYGVADAEHLVEKEITRAVPAARVSVVEVRREGEPRIVEEFGIEYLIRTEIHVSAADPATAKGAAFRHARRLLSGTRYRLTEWEAVTPPGS